jgi:glycosyltransferase involved in cell wall biosynthesis
VKPPTATLKILWLSTLSLTKGLPYALEAARMLQGKPVRLTLVGPLAVKPDGVSLPPNAEWIGPVPRSQTSALYSAHDVFLFPTLSDGFGITQLEALAHGMPVIATPNCGNVVENAVSGFIVPPRDAKGIADVITAFLDEPARLPAMSAAALTRSRDFAPERVWPEWRRVLWPEWQPSGRQVYLRSIEERSHSAS